MIEYRASSSVEDNESIRQITSLKWGMGRGGEDFPSEAQEAADTPTRVMRLALKKTSNENEEKDREICRKFQCTIEINQSVHPSIHGSHPERNFFTMRLSVPWPP